MHEKSRCSILSQIQQAKHNLLVILKYWRGCDENQASK